jgi:hypothetical protein
MEPEKRVIPAVSSHPPSCILGLPLISNNGIAWTIW